MRLALLIIASSLLAGTDPADQVRAAAEASLDARMAGSARFYRIEVVRLVGTPDPLPDVQVLLPDRPLLPKGRVQVRLVESSSGAGAGAALLHLARYDSVAVLAAPVERGSPVDPAQLRFAWIETTRFTGSPLTRAVLLGQQNLQATRSLPADRPLRIGDLSPPLAAETGDRIRMQFARHGFRLELSCTARDRGHAGDTIRLYADDGDVMYRARLTGPGTAEWIETLQNR